MNDLFRQSKFTFLQLFLSPNWTGREARFALELYDPATPTLLTD